MHMNKKTLTAIVIALIVVIGAVGAIALTGNDKQSATTSSTTSSDSTSTTPQNNSSASSDDSAPVTTTTVKIQNFAFTPATIKVKVGDTVTWTNEDSIGHTVTADDSSAGGPSSELLAQGKSYSYKFTKAGTYEYHCQPHPYMKGTVQVTE
jgi:amicyanin